MEEYNVPPSSGERPSYENQHFHFDQGVRAGRRPSMEHALRVGRRFSNDEAPKRPGRRFSNDDQPFNPNENPNLTMRHTSTADKSYLHDKTKTKRRPSLETGVPHKPRQTQKQYQRKYTSNRYSHLCRFWLCATVVIGIMICLGRSIRITLDVTTSNQGVSGGVFPSFEGTRSSLRTAQKRNMPFSYNFIFYDQEKLHRERNNYRQTEEDVLPAIQELLLLAEAALDLGPWSVRQKPSESDSLAESGNEKDFFFAASQYWSKKHSHGKNEFHENERSSVNIPYADESGKLKQSHMPDALRNTTILGLAYFLSGNADYAEAAVRNVRTWFLDKSTMMTPHLFYLSDMSSTATDIFELKDLYFFLDVIQMVMEFLENSEVAQLMDWFAQYMDFLETSVQAKTEKKSKGHNGLYFDIQQIAVANFLGDQKKVARAWRRAESRVSDQIAASDGALIEELQHDSCEHYQMFTLQGWWTLARMGLNILDKPKLWETHKHALCRASEYVIPYFRKRSQCPGNTNKENDQRWWPLVVEAVSHCPELQNREFIWREWMSEESKSIPANLYDMPRVYSISDGVAPFWNLGMPILNKSSPGLWQEKAGRESESLLQEQKRETLDVRKKESDAQKLKETASKTSLTDQKLSNAGPGDSNKNKSGSENEHNQPTSGIIPNDQADNFIPLILKKAAKTNPDMKERIDRIKRWQSLGQTKIVQKMIKKSLDEMLNRRS